MFWEASKRTTAGCKLFSEVLDVLNLVQVGQCQTTNATLTLKCNLENLKSTFEDL